MVEGVFLLKLEDYCNMGESMNFKSQEEIDRDFSVYEAGVLRLKNLEELLNHLNTLGFWEDEKDIRAKLRDVTEISEVERLIDVLKKKIIKKQGKENMYRKTFAPLKRRKVHRKKPEVIVGDVPEPIKDLPEKTSEQSMARPAPKVEKEKSSLRNLIPVIRKEKSQKNYEAEIKGAIGQGSRKPAVVDSSFSESQERERKRLEVERARLEKEKLDVESRGKVVEGDYKKYHNISLSMDRYSSDKAKSREVISGLRNLYALRGKKKVFSKF